MGKLENMVRKIKNNRKEEKDYMNTILKEQLAREEGIEIGEQIGRKEGIEKIIEIYREELGFEDEIIVRKLMKKYDLTKEEVEKYL